MPEHNINITDGCPENLTGTEVRQVRPVLTQCVIMQCQELLTL